MEKPMKQFLLAIVAAVALSFPAMAQNNMVQEPNNNIQMPHKNRAWTLP